MASIVYVVCVCGVRVVVVVVTEGGAQRRGCENFSAIDFAL